MCRLYVTDIKVETSKYETTLFVFKFKDESRSQILGPYWCQWDTRHTLQ